jgi:hypothetical protein
VTTALAVWLHLEGTTLIKPARSFALVAAAALALTACGSGSSSKKAAESQLGAIQSAVAQGASASNSAASSGSSTSGVAAASIDACALLTAADVNAVAKTDKLDSAQTASTVYTLEATKEPSLDEDSECSFEVDDPAASLREGTIEFIVDDASNISDYNDGTKVSGLGDEAYTVGSTGFAVRVGGLLLVALDQDYFSAATVTDLLRRMIPRLNS